MRQLCQINNRHADSHDVLSIYDQVVDYQGMSITPKTPDELIVSPDDVVGTLTQAFSIYKSVPEGLARAIFLQFLVSE
ncbi:hypothetical protein V6D52_13395 [Idiomarina loihiensis]|uniref:hypothetical protein n=1 Tax=Idiomarina loihiensis TaxID=135577 RepID=UPI0039BEB274